MMGLQRNCLFWTLITQPNDQFCCLHWTTNEIKQCNWRKAARIDKSKRCCIPSWQCKATHIFGKNYWSLVGMFCHIHHIVLTLHHLITFCFDLYKNSLNDKNFNNDDDIESYLIQFFANKNHKFYERGITMLPERWQKVVDQNGQLHYRIKLFSSMKKIVFDFLKKNPQLLNCQPNNIVSHINIKY